MLEAPEGCWRLHKDVPGSGGVLEVPQGCSRLHRDVPGSTGISLPMLGNISSPLCLPRAPELGAGRCFLGGGDPSPAVVTAPSPLWYQTLDWGEEDAW